MRVVFYGLSELTQKTAPRFVEENHDVIIIDPDHELISSVNEELDCAFLAGDASYPAVLKEVNPKETDLFFALSDNNQSNMVACLVARSLGIKRVILRVDDPDFESVCTELGLSEVIIPSMITSQYLEDAVFNESLLELFQFMKEEVFVHKVIATADECGAIADLKLAKHCDVICYFRDGKYYRPDDSTRFEEKDQLIIITDIDHKQELIDRFSKQETQGS